MFESRALLQLESAEPLLEPFVAHLGHAPFLLG